jgi:hypothetical protein
MRVTLSAVASMVVVIAGGVAAIGFGSPTKSLARAADVAPAAKVASADCDGCPCPECPPECPPECRDCGMCCLDDAGDVICCPFDTCDQAQCPVSAPACPRRQAAGGHSECPGHGCAR